MSDSDLMAAAKRMRRVAHEAEELARQYERWPTAHNAEMLALCAASGAWHDLYEAMRAAAVSAGVLEKAP